MSLTLVLSLLFAPLVTADALELNLHHRLYHPTASLSSFSPRGTIVVANNKSISFKPSASFLEDWPLFGEELNAFPDTDNLLYQVALEHPGDFTEGQWDISSLKVVRVNMVASPQQFY